MDKQVKIRTPDKKFIYGTLTQGSTDNLIIFVHGLTGHQNEHMFYNGAAFFTKNSYSTFRFDLYTDQKEGRHFSETTLKTHSADLDTVVNHFKKFKITLIGHSLGGPTILLSNLASVQRIVLWDPTQGLRKEIPSWCKYDKRLDAYRISWATDIITTKAYYKQMMELPSMPEIVKKLQIPVRVILAGKGILRNKWQAIDDYVIIKNATHCFDEEGTEEELFRCTHDFLTRQILKPSRVPKENVRKSARRRP